MEQIREIARRIAELREICGYSRERLAAELNIDVDVYSEYERSGENIPISVIFQIANKFGVDFNDILTGRSAKLDTYHIVKNGRGRSIERYEGYSYEDLAYRYGHKIMQPLLVRLEPSNETAALVTHGGQEYNYVVEGEMIFNFDGREFLLEKGDSIYFNPAYPHGQRCGGEEPTVFLTVIAE
jgi:mannose-6-phosphate isomerase-like protein (cupin superfamily)/DNA-binding XRE family transcriptional regulator